MSFCTEIDGEAIVHEKHDGQVFDLSFELRGRIAPFLEVTLASGEGLVCDHRCVLQHDMEISVKNWPGLGGTRLLAVNASHEPEASVMLSTSEPGFAGAFELSEYGGLLICPSENLMANGPGVTAGYYARFRRMGLSLVLLKGDGWVFLRSRGDVFRHKLAPGEKLSLRAHSVAAITATVNFEAHSDDLMDPLKSEFVTLTGPGTIWLQSILPMLQPRPPARVNTDHLAVQEMHTGGLAFVDGTSA